MFTSAIENEKTIQKLLAKRSEKLIRYIFIRDGHVSNVICLGETDNLRRRIGEYNRKDFPEERRSVHEVPLVAYFGRIPKKLRPSDKRYVGFCLKQGCTYHPRPRGNTQKTNPASKGTETVFLPTVTDCDVTMGNLRLQQINAVALQMAKDGGILVDARLVNAVCSTFDQQDRTYIIDCAQRAYHDESYQPDADAARILAEICRLFSHEPQAIPPQWQANIDFWYTYGNENGLRSIYKAIAVWRSALKNESDTQFFRDLLGWFGLQQWPEALERGTPRIVICHPQTLFSTPTAPQQWYTQYAKPLQTNFNIILSEAELHPRRISHTLTERLLLPHLIQPLMLKLLSSDPHPSRWTDVSSLEFIVERSRGVHRW